MAYDFMIRRVAVQPTMSIRGQANLADLVGTIGEYLTEVWRYVQESGARPAGPPFTRYHAVAGASIDLEAGLPVSAALPGKGRIRPGELPGGEVAVTTHIGPYDGLVAAGEALQA
jgi:effector-binding domain-containing protein